MRQAWRTGRPDARGQVLVIVAAGMVVLIGLVGLVIDGGYAWGQQRKTQNGADAAAKAGTIQIQQYYAGGAQTDGDVGCAVKSAADDNTVDIDQAIYTNYLGDPLVPEVAVGACGATGAVPGDAQGVRATATQTFGTFLAGVIGFSELTATANATAIVGTAPGICPADAGCGALPLTFPQTMSLCDSTEAQYVVREDQGAGEPGHGVWEPYELIPEGTGLDASNLAVIPLCDIDSGSVGWLDFDCGSNLADEVGTPCNDYIPIPDWLHSQTGNVNNAEDEMRTHTGDVAGSAANEGVTDPQPEDKVLMLPVHVNTCDVDPGEQDWCPPSPGPDDQWQGEGDNLYYYVDLWIGFKLDAAYMQGGDVECKTPNTQGQPILSDPVPAGKVGCLKGWIIDFYSAPGGIEAADLNPGDSVPLRVGLVN